MTKKFLQEAGIYDLERNLLGKFFFADDEQEEVEEEVTEDRKGGKTEI
ncbi:hypothetical protein [Flavobacterium limi]|uniref:Uncharacterized protein n=1 Tax=Flavobacterium limi TaxID=2045105 RepID=A0ABQ1UP50_9FLAO|nr:hypothetical protein [Flavobacterium limi]GGF23147.1 hypothetical protein GCM10011518_35560 [Flavobacterium limi]